MNIYKKISGLALMMLILGSCSKGYNDDALVNQMQNISNRVSALESKVVTLNQNVNSLTKIANSNLSKIYVTSVTELRDGYRVTFSNNSFVDLTNGYVGKDGLKGQDGRDGVTPVIGLEEIDGDYYWTISVGESVSYLYNDDGKKLPVSYQNYYDDAANGANGRDGVTPVFRIDESGFWNVSYDGGGSYMLLYDEKREKISALAVSSSNETLSFSESEDYYYLIFPGGRKISVEKYRPFNLLISKLAGWSFDSRNTCTIPYSINGADYNTNIELYEVGNISAVLQKTSATEGSIIVSALGSIDNDTQLHVFLYNDSQTVTKTISFR